MTAPKRAARRVRSNRWREYERRKAEFLGRKPGAPPPEFEQFLRHLASKLGL